MSAKDLLYIPSVASLYERSQHLGPFCYVTIQVTTFGADGKKYVTTYKKQVMDAPFNLAIAETSVAGLDYNYMKETQELDKQMTIEEYNEAIRRNMIQQ
jgi:hypothetical protein